MKGFFFFFSLNGPSSEQELPSVIGPNETNSEQDSIQRH